MRLREWFLTRTSDRNDADQYTPRGAAPTPKGLAYPKWGIGFCKTAILAHGKELAVQEDMMSSLRLAAVAGLATTLINVTPSIGAEAVGQAVLIKTAVTGATGPLVVKAPVHRDERIRTSNTGLGQFEFLDGTKLAVGWGSSVVIDKYVFDDSNSVKKLTIRAAKGTFRWISGNSNSSAYRILTPAGTIGVRGTAFDFYVAPNGKTAVVLLNGLAQICGSGGCRELRRRCDCVIATPGGGLTQASRVNRSVLASMGSTRALPFLTGNQALSRGFGLGGANCGLSTAAAFQGDQHQNRQQPARQGASAPSRGNAPSPGAPSPSRASSPSPSKPKSPSASPSSPPSAPPGGNVGDGNNGHGNDPGRHDVSNPGKSFGPGNRPGNGKQNGNGNGNGSGNGKGKNSSR